MRNLAGSKIVYDWLIKNGRMTSRKYLVGESYGGFRGPRITDYLRAHPERTPVNFETLDDVTASIGRAHLAMARHRQKVGGLSRDELERLKGRPLNDAEEQFLREVQQKPD